MRTIVEMSKVRHNPLHKVSIEEAESAFIDITGLHSRHPEFTKGAATPFLRVRASGGGWLVVQFDNNQNGARVLEATIRENVRVLQKCPSVRKRLLGYLNAVLR